MSHFPEGVPEFVIGDDEAAVVDLLRELQRAVLSHPEAARALFNAFGAEGRSFAQTTEGRHWKEKILRSTLLERAMLVWHSATLWANEEGGRHGAPSAFVDAVAAAAASPRRDRLLDALFRHGQDEGDHEPPR